MAAWLRPLILMIFSGQLTALPEIIKIGKFVFGKDSHAIIFYLKNIFYIIMLIYALLKIFFRLLRIFGLKKSLFFPNNSI